MSSLAFKPKTQELARRHGYDAKTLAQDSGLALNTAKVWMSDLPMSYLNIDVLEKLMTLFNPDHWTDLVEVVEADNGAGQ